jgi:hypothetical protein
MLLCGIYLFFIGYKKEEMAEKLMLVGYACIFLGFSFARLFFLTADFQIDGIYIDHTFYYDEATEYSPNYILLIKLAYTTLMIGFACFIFVYERGILHTKYFFSILNIIFIILLLISSGRLTFNIATISLTINVSLYLFLFLFMAKRSSEKFKIIVAFLLSGSMIGITGHILDTTVIGDLLNLPTIIPPLLQIFGVIVMISPFLINLERFKKGIILWYTTICSLFAAFIVVFISLLSTPEESYQRTDPILTWITIFITLALFILILVRMMLILKKKREKKPEEFDFIKVFTKPQRITEEEISISKEKKICLVCKGNLSRTMYICPDCYTFYCMKCSTTLITLENACWVCETPFDESKPVKRILHEEKEKSALKVGEHIKK